MRIRKSDNKALVEQIEHDLKENGGYCPCRLEHTKDTRCMCKEFREQIADPAWSGECHCGYYVKEL